MYYQRLSHSGYVHLHLLTITFYICQHYPYLVLDFIIYFKIKILNLILLMFIRGRNGPIFYGPAWPAAARKLKMPDRTAYLKIQDRPGPARKVVRPDRTGPTWPENIFRELWMNSKKDSVSRKKAYIYVLLIYWWIWPSHTFMK